MPSTAGAKSYRDLIVWQRAMDLALWVDLIARQLPQSHAALADHLRRAALSVPANIAEGTGRVHYRDYARFVSVARGSLREVETHLLIGLRLGLIRRGDIVEPLEFGDQLNRMLTKLIVNLRRADPP